MGADVHTPWTLSSAMLSHAHVSLGETYPTPIVVAPEWSRHFNKKLVSAWEKGSWQHDHRIWTLFLAVAAVRMRSAWYLCSCRWVIMKHTAFLFQSGAGPSPRGRKGPSHTPKQHRDRGIDFYFSRSKNLWSVSSGKHWNKLVLQTVLLTKGSWFEEMRNPSSWQKAAERGLKQHAFSILSVVLQWRKLWFLPLMLVITSYLLCLLLGCLSGFTVPV